MHDLCQTSHFNVHLLLKSFYFKADATNCIMLSFDTSLIIQKEWQLKKSLQKSVTLKLKLS